MTERNKSKLAILNALEDLREATIKELYLQLDEEMAIDNLCHLAENYRQQKLISRTSRKRPYCYAITEKGLERLNHLKKIQQEKSS